MRNLLDCCIVAGLACILSCGSGEDDGSAQELHDLALANDAYKSWTPFPGQTMLAKSGDQELGLDERDRAHADPLGLDPVLVERPVEAVAADEIVGLGVAGHPQARQVERGCAADDSRPGFSPGAHCAV